MGTCVHLSRSLPSNSWWQTMAGWQVLSRPSAAEGGGRRPAFTRTATQPYSATEVDGWQHKAQPGVSKPGRSTIAASIELVRTTTPVDLGISVQVQAAEARIIAAAARLITPSSGDDVDVGHFLVATPPLEVAYSDTTATLAAVIIATIRRLGCGMAGNADAGAGALLELALDYPVVALSTVVSANVSAAVDNSAAFIDLARLAALTAWCESLARRCYASPLEVLHARAAVLDRLSHNFGRAANAANMNVRIALQILQGATVQYLTRLIVDFALTAKTPLSTPETWQAKWLISPPVDLSLHKETLHPTSITGLAPGPVSMVSGPSRGRVAEAISLGPASHPG